MSRPPGHPCPRKFWLGRIRSADNDGNDDHNDKNNDIDNIEGSVTVSGDSQQKSAAWPKHLTGSAEQSPGRLLY